MDQNVKYCFLAVFCALACYSARAQYADDGFNPDANGEVHAITIQADGKIILGGCFDAIGGVAQTRVGRVLSNGRLDTTFAPGVMAGIVGALAIQADGKIIIGGEFSEVAGQGRYNLARLNADGSLDAAFNPNTVATENDKSVTDLAIQPDGKIIVGGDFVNLGGQMRNFIGRLNADGSLDTAFNPTANGGVCAIVVQPDGKILVGGDFSLIGGTNRLHVARLNTDGSIDSTFVQTNGADVAVSCLALQADGKILIGGAFENAGGQARARIARLNSDGSLDASFNPLGQDDEVRAMAVQPDGKIIVGGNFTILSGGARTRIGRLNADGTLDTTFTSPDGALDRVYALAVQSDGGVLAGGAFHKIGNVDRNHIARLNTNGSLDTTFDLTDGADNSVSSLAMQSDGKIIVGGYYDNIGGKARKRLARIANTEAALQTLNVSNTGSAVTWTRTGASPEIWLTTFDQSTNGLTWTYLGAGTRITNGWQLTGLSLPMEQTIYIRARGYGIGGMWNSSISIYESIRLSYLTPSAIITITNVSGTVTGYYGAVNYTLSGTNNANVTGTMWWTNSLGGNSYFASINPWSVTVTNLSVGTNLITVCGFNTVGNMASNSATIVQRRNDYLAADFDGDHMADPAYCNGTNWYEWLSGTPFYTRTNAYNHSIAGAFPAAGDFNGDGLADPAVYDNKTANWYIWLSPLYWQIGPLPYGVIGAAPVLADFDDDQITDFAVYSAGSWYVWISTDNYNGYGPFNYGPADAIPIAGDFDGDRRADPAVFIRGIWYAWFSLSGYAEIGPLEHGDPDAFPVAADFDGDRICDIATVKEGIWYAWLSMYEYTRFGPFTFNASGWSWVPPTLP